MTRALVAALLAAGLAAPGTASAQRGAWDSPPGAGPGSVFAGQAEVVDGDTLRVAGVLIRLSGVDAPERDQWCVRGGRRWDCFAAANHALAGLIGAAPVRCIETGRSFNRVTARCWVGLVEIGSWMVAEGWAVASTRYGPEYRALEAEARAARRGLWSSRFVHPEDWRRR